MRPRSTSVSRLGAQAALAVVLIFVLALAGTPAPACEYPDEGNMPLRRAVSKVKYLPETLAWARRMREQGLHVHYAVHLDLPAQAGGRCYWPVEIRADGRLWRRYLVSPDGAQVRSMPTSGTEDRPGSAGR